MIVDIQEILKNPEEEGTLAGNAIYAKKGDIVVIHTISNTEYVLPPYVVGRIIHCFNNYLVYEVQN